MPSLTIRFCHDLTSPTGESTTLGKLVIDGDKFVRFDWEIDPKNLPLPASDFAREIVRSTDEHLRILVDEDWPRFRDSTERRKYDWDPATAAEFVAHSLRYSSVYVAAIDPA